MAGYVEFPNRSKAVLDVRPSFLPCLFARLAPRSKLRRWRLVGWRHLEEHADIHTKRGSQFFQKIDRGIEATVFERAHGSSVHAGIDRQMLLADTTRCSGSPQIPSYSITDLHAPMPRILMPLYPSGISNIITLRLRPAYLPTTEFQTPPHTHHTAAGRLNSVLGRRSRRSPMKIATGIIAMLLGMLVLLQSCTVGTASHMIGDKASSDAGGIGLIAGFLIFVGGAFAFGLPFVSVIVFMLAGLLALMGAAEFPDLRVWAIACFILATMAFFAWRAGRKSKVAAAQASHTDAGQ